MVDIKFEGTLLSIEKLTETTGNITVQTTKYADNQLKLYCKDIDVLKSLKVGDKLKIEAKVNTNAKGFTNILSKSISKI